MAEGDQLRVLEHKLQELKKYRDVIQNEVAIGAGGITRFEEELHRLSTAQENKRRIADAKLAKAHRLELIIRQVETSTTKLLDYADKLESILDQELHSATNPPVS